jgi:hypothetical protein
VNLLQCVLRWLDPSPPAPPDEAAADARHAEAQVETVRILRAALHGRMADKQIREAREELARQKARVATLDVQAEVRGRRALGNE